jgi:hypothetical protein
MMKKYFIAALFSVFTMTAFAGPLWHCIVNNQQGAVWNLFGKTERATRYAVEKECRPYNHGKECPIVCFPPRIYWRCLSHDTLPKSASQSIPAPSRGTWYWTSFSKTVAINGARDACRHNSAFGGCYVNPKECASS